jgi:hypothetical protein
MGEPIPLPWPSGDMVRIAAAYRSQALEEIG